MRVKKGLDIPINGMPDTLIDSHVNPISHVAVFGRDYWGLKPKMIVSEGDSVLTGQPIFTDKSYPNIVFVAPATGKIIAINRSQKRFLESVVIAIDHKAESNSDIIKYDIYDLTQIMSLSHKIVQHQLLISGLWPQIRTRPYSKLANPAQKPMAFFVNLMDTNPLSFNPALILKGRENELLAGLLIISKLTEGKIFICKSPDTVLSDQITKINRVSVHNFSGPHPAGLVGTHIHYLAPVNSEKTVWHIDAQDLLAFGHLFLTGRYPCKLFIAIAGPIIKTPRVIVTRRGACISELVHNEIDFTKANGKVRTVAGSLLNGRQANKYHDYLGAFHRQISVISEYSPKRLLGWLIPGWNRFATAHVHLSSLINPQYFDISASANGSPRAMVPFGLYEEVMPMDILPTQLLRSLLVLDTDVAQGLGALELDEEDLALCSYVCLSKYEYGTALRSVLTLIEAEG